MKKITAILVLLLISIFVLAAFTNKSLDSTDHARLMKVESMLEIQSVLAAYAMAWDREDTKEFCIDHPGNKEIRSRSKNAYFPATN